MTLSINVACTASSLCECIQIHVQIEPINPSSDELSQSPTALGLKARKFVRFLQSPKNHPEKKPPSNHPNSTLRTLTPNPSSLIQKPAPFRPDRQLTPVMTTKKCMPVPRNSIITPVSHKPWNKPAQPQNRMHPAQPASNHQCRITFRKTLPFNQHNHRFRRRIKPHPRLLQQSPAHVRPIARKPKFLTPVPLQDMPHRPVAKPTITIVNHNRIRPAGIRTSL